MILDVVSASCRFLLTEAATKHQVDEDRNGWGHVGMQSLGVARSGKMGLVVWKDVYKWVQDLSPSSDVCSSWCRTTKHFTSPNGRFTLKRGPKPPQFLMVSHCIFETSQRDREDEVADDTSSGHLKGVGITHRSQLGVVQKTEVEKTW